jgi:hypothetical protein
MAGWLAPSRRPFCLSALARMMVLCEAVAMRWVSAGRAAFGGLPHYGVRA